MIHQLFVLVVSFLVLKQGSADFHESVRSDASDVTNGEPYPMTVSSKQMGDFNDFHDGESTPTMVDLRKMTVTDDNLVVGISSFQDFEMDLKESTDYDGVASWYRRLQKNKKNKVVAPVAPKNNNKNNNNKNNNNKNNNNKNNKNNKNKRARHAV